MYAPNQIEDQPYQNSVDLSSVNSNNSRFHVNQTNLSGLSGQRSNRSLLYQFDSSNTSKGSKSRNSLARVLVTNKNRVEGGINKTSLVQVEQPKHKSESSSRDGRSQSHNSSFGMAAIVEQINMSAQESI